MTRAESHADVSVVEGAVVDLRYVCCGLALEAFDHREILRRCLAAALELLGVNQRHEGLLFVSAGELLLGEVDAPVAAAHNQLLGEQNLRLVIDLQANIGEVWSAISATLLPHVFL